MRKLLISLLLASLPGTAAAVLPPRVYDAARDQAQFRVHLRITAAKLPAKTPGRCRVTGEVVRVLRARAPGLKVGDKLTVDVECYREGERLPMGPVLWKTWAAVRKARYLDAYLNRRGTDYFVPRYQTRIIAGPATSTTATRGTGPSTQPAPPSAATTTQPTLRPGCRRCSATDGAPSAALWLLFAALPWWYLRRRRKGGEV